MNTPDPATPPMDCLLTLVAPQALEEELIDALLERPELAPGFSVLPGQGLGRQVQLASAMEQVQGRARRVLIQIAMQQQQVDTLLQALRSHFGGAQIAYWAVPLLQFGRFA